MNKRIFAMLMALAMIISMVPFTAMAACNHANSKWEDNGDGTHSWNCADCGFQKDKNIHMSTINPDHCYICQAPMGTTEPDTPVEPEEPECSHNGRKSYTHTEDYALCNEWCFECKELLRANIPHQFTNGACFCGALASPVKPEEPECSHNGRKSYTHTEDYALCNEWCYECKELLRANIPHQFTNGACFCGAIKPNHEHTMDKLVSISKTQHQFKCECDELVGVPMNHYDADGDRFCDGCGEEVYKAADECKHEWKGVVNNGDATHNVVCRDCEEVLGAESHKFVNGICACGAIYVEAECEHEWKGVANNGDATHNIICRDCLEVLGAESHKFVNGICACGAIYVETECKHEWKGVTLMDEAHHEIVCRDCLEVLGIESHKFVDGRPCACGKIYVEDECKHEWKGVVNNGADHNVICRDCQEVLSTEAHKYAANGICACGAICQHEWKGLVNKGADHDVVCRDCLTVLGAEAHDYTLMGTCACGAIKPAHKCTFEAGVTSNGDGSHKVNCECGNFVTVTCLDNDGDGKCDSCGYVKYAHKCTYEAGVTSNNNGTHNVNCECGKFVTINCLDNDGDRKCDSCGYEKYPEVENKPVVDNKDYDNVPKTGDILAMILAFFGF